MPTGEGFGDGYLGAFVEDEFVNALEFWGTFDGDRSIEDDGFVVAVEEVG